MDAILSFFQGIADFIVTIFQFVISFFRDLVYIIKITGEMLLELPNYINWLPTYITTPIIALFGIVVIYKIMGRTT